MRYYFPDYALAYVIASIISFLSAVVTWRRRSNLGNTAFSLLMLSLCAWSFASIFEAGAVSAEGKLFWSQWQYLGVASLSPLWLYFAAEFTGRDFFRKKTCWLMLIIPCITLIMAFTNQYHHLLWSRIIVQPQLFNIAIYVHGPWFYVHLIYSYLLLLLGTYWLIVGLLNNSQKKRRQIFIIIFGLILGWTSNLLYVSGLFPVKGLDITPLSFTFIAILLFWNISNFRLFDIVPVARDLLLDSMTDGVVVLDLHDTVVDLNPAAQKFLKQKNVHSPMGRSIWKILDQNYPQFKELMKKRDFQTELQLSEDPPQFLNLSVSSIYDRSHIYLGRLLSFRDITTRKLVENKEKEQRVLAEALADTAAIINSTLQLDEVMENILTNVGKVVPHDTANISLVEGGDTVHFIRTKGYEKYGAENIIPGIVRRYKEIPNMKHMAETGQACINPDTEADPDWDRNIPGSSWIRSYMGAPIIGKGQLLGFINLDSATPNFFKEEYVPRLEAFANQAAVAIQNAQLFLEVAETANQMKTLYEASSEITAGLEFERIIKTLFDKLKNVLKIDLFYMAVLNSENTTAAFTIFQGDGTKIDYEPLSITDKPSFTRYVLEKRATVYIPDLHAEDSEYPDKKMVKIPGHNERSIIGIPLKRGEEMLGVLCLQANEPNAYDLDQILLVETIAHQASVTINNAQLFERIQNMAILDTLTGVYNRRYFYEYAENEINRSQRYDNPVSMIMIDIDHFKLVNDRFGHPIGDLTLKMVADTCLSVLRKADVLCRFGGEEFLVLLPETDQKDAVIAAKRICQAIAEKSLPTNLEIGPVTVTVSIGVTQLKDKEETMNDLINEADQALYEAKKTGRNRVCIYKA